MKKKDKLKLHEFLTKCPLCKKTGELQTLYTDLRESKLRIIFNCKDKLGCGHTWIVSADKDGI